MCIRDRYKIDGERAVKYEYEEWLISSFDESVSEWVTMISARDASASEKTATILSFELCHWISLGPTWLFPRWFNVSAPYCGSGIFFYTTLFFVTDPKFHSLYTLLSSDNSHSRTLRPKNYHIFGKLWMDVSFDMVVPWICVSISKSQVICRKAKKTRFLHFLAILCKKNSSGRQSDNIEAWRLAHSSFRSWCSKFFKTPVEVSDTFKNFGPSPVRSWMIQNSDTQKSCF